MDLLIERGEYKKRLSEYGLYALIVSETSPTISLSQREVSGRNGFIYDGATLTQKIVKISGRICCSDTKEFLKKKDELNGLLFTVEPFYITKMYPVTDDFYHFELPGTVSGELDFVNIEHKPWHYRYKVVVNEGLEFSFLGKSQAGLKYDCTFSFVTAELPFGETHEKNVSLSHGSFSYQGTAPVSQLELPFAVELISNGGQTSFYLEINNRRFTYEHAVVDKKGDRYLISGIGTTLNDVDVTNRTNYEYFVVDKNKDNLVFYQTNFEGSIQLVHFKEFFY